MTYTPIPTALTHPVILPTTDRTHPATHSLTNQLPNSPSPLNLRPDELSHWLQYDTYTTLARRYLGDSVLEYELELLLEMADATRVPM
jgi:hypothetical protein